MPKICHQQLASVCIDYLMQPELVNCDSIVLLRYFDTTVGCSCLQWIEPKVTVSEAAQASDALLANYDLSHLVDASQSRPFNEISLIQQMAKAELPLIHYCTHVLHSHLNSSEKYQVSQSYLLDLFLTGGTQWVQLWYALQHHFQITINVFFHLPNWADFVQAAVVLELGCLVKLLRSRIENEGVVLPPHCNLSDALYLAIKLKRADIAVDLIGCGANPNVIDTKGNVHLHNACAQGETAMVESLIQHGADVKMTSAVQSAVLHYAATFGTVEIVKLLINAGAELEARTFRGATPLLVAAARDQLDIFKLLIRHGADRHANDSEGRDASATAAQHSSSSVYAFLNPTAPDIPLQADEYIRRRVLSMRQEPISRDMTASPVPRRSSIPPPETPRRLWNWRPPRPPPPPRQSELSNMYSGCGRVILQSLRPLQHSYATRPPKGPSYDNEEPDHSY